MKCKHKKVYDYSRGEIVCGICGVVLQDRLETVSIKKAYSPITNIIFPQPNSKAYKLHYDEELILRYNKKALNIINKLNLSQPVLNYTSQLIKGYTAKYLSDHCNINTIVGAFIYIAISKFAQDNYLMYRNVNDIAKIAGVKTKILLKTVMKLEDKLGIKVEPVPFHVKISYHLGKETLDEKLKREIYDYIMTNIDFYKTKNPKVTVKRLVKTFKHIIK